MNQEFELELDINLIKQKTYFFNSDISMISLNNTRSIKNLGIHTLNIHENDLSNIIIKYNIGFGPTSRYFEFITSLNLCILLLKNKNFDDIIPLSPYNLLYNDNFFNDIILYFYGCNKNYNIILNKIKPKKKLCFIKSPKAFLKEIHLGSYYMNLDELKNIIFKTFIEYSYVKIIGIILEIRIRNSENIEIFNKIDKIKINSDNGKKHIFFDDLGQIKKKLINKSYFLTIFFDENYDDIIDILKNKTIVKGIKCINSISIELIINKISANVVGKCNIYLFNSYVV